MSMSGRPVSLQAALILKRAQAARERAAAVPVQAPRRAGFSIARLFGSDAGGAVVEEVEPRKLAA